VTISRCPGPVNPVTIVLADANPFDVAMPDSPRVARQRKPLLIAGGIKQTQLDPLRMGGKQGKINPIGGTHGTHHCRRAFSQIQHTTYRLIDGRTACDRFPYKI